MSLDNPEAQQPEIILFPHLQGAEQTVSPGDYKLIEGDDRPVHIGPDQLFLPNADFSYKDSFPGIHNRGWYGRGGRQSYPVVSFLYHKQDPEGNLETTERAIIWKGIGYGTHPGHTGQDAGWYLVGAEVAKFDTETGSLVSMIEEADVTMPVKHFLMACITGGPLGEPVLANS